MPRSIDWKHDRAGQYAPSRQRLTYSVARRQNNEVLVELFQSALTVLEKAADDPDSVGASFLAQNQRVFRICRSVLLTRGYQTLEPEPEIVR